MRYLVCTLVRVLGGMSLVGPRPIVDAEIPRYGAVYEMYWRIRPGISGLWQVSGRSDTGYDERVELDAYYVNTWSVWLGLVILVSPVRRVIFRRGTNRGCSSKWLMQVDVKALYLVVGYQAGSAIAQPLTSC